MTPTCSDASPLDPCTSGDKVMGRGLCPRHYQRRRYHGTLPTAPPERTCDHCGETYQPRKWNTSYCSRRCSDAAAYRREQDTKGPRAAQCEQCGGSLDGKTRKARFCSNRCGQTWRNAQTAAARWAAILAARKPCKGCGGKIPDTFKSDALYCSKPCRIKARRQEAYGLTADELQILLDQHAVCRICKTDDWGKKGPQVDHCHATGRVRGVLCINCNNGLGRFADDSARLRAAADYLDEAAISPN